MWEYFFIFLLTFLWPKSIIQVRYNVLTKITSVSMKYLCMKFSIWLLRCTVCILFIKQVTIKNTPLQMKCAFVFVCRFLIRFLFLILYVCVVNLSVNLNKIPKRMLGQFLFCFVLRRLDGKQNWPADLP